MRVLNSYVVVQRVFRSGDEHELTIGVVWSKRVVLPRPKVEGVTILSRIFNL